MGQPVYMAFMDESGISNLNDTTSDFLLCSVIIDKKDFQIIEGYLRLLKRRHLSDDFKPLHASALFEKTKTYYPELTTPRKVNSFLHQLMQVLDSIPFMCRVYYVDKTKLRNKYSYVPVRKKKPASINTELPYVSAAEYAITDLTKHLIANDAKGEVVIESRLFNDSHFVSAFDNVRKQKDPSTRKPPFNIEIKDRITSLHIANKNQQDGCLEVADLCAYVIMRHEYDKTKVSKGAATQIGNVFGAIKKHAYKDVSETSVKLVYEISP